MITWVPRLCLLLLMGLWLLPLAVPSFAQDAERACRSGRSWPLHAGRLTESVPDLSLDAGRLVLVWARDGGRACVGHGETSWVDERVVARLDPAPQDLLGEWFTLYGRDGHLTIGPGLDGAEPTAEGFLQSGLGHGTCSEGGEFHVSGGEMLSGHVRPHDDGTFEAPYEPDVTFTGWCPNLGLVRSEDLGRRCRAELRQVGPFLAVRLAEGCGTDGENDPGMIVLIRASDDP